jgi:hypothetical protein
MPTILNSSVTPILDSHIWIVIGFTFLMLFIAVVILLCIRIEEVKDLKKEIKFLRRYS